MTKHCRNFCDWPRSENKAPIFNNTQQALYYAQLIYNRPDDRHLLEIYLEDSYIKLKAARESHSVNPSYLIQTSLQAQFFRECSEEIHRIDAEHLKDVKRNE